MYICFEMVFDILLQSLERLTGFLRQHAAHTRHKPQEMSDYWWRPPRELVIISLEGCFGHPPPKSHTNLYLEFLENMSLSLLYIITEGIRLGHLSMEDLPHLRISSADTIGEMQFGDILSDFFCMHRIYPEKEDIAHSAKKQQILRELVSIEKSLGRIRLNPPNPCIATSIVRLKKLKTLVQESI